MGAPPAEGCGAALRRSGPRWRALSMDDAGARAEKVWLWTLLQCVKLTEPKHIFFETLFFPALYVSRFADCGFGLPEAAPEAGTAAGPRPRQPETAAGHSDFSGVDLGSSAANGSGGAQGHGAGGRGAGGPEGVAVPRRVCEARARLLRRHGALRRHGVGPGAAVTWELPDVLPLGLCVPEACGARGSTDDVLDLALPAWLADGEGGLPSARCCARALQRLAWGGGGGGDSGGHGALVAGEVEPRGRWPRPWPGQGYVAHHEDAACVAAFRARGARFGELFGAALRARVVRQGGGGNLWQQVREPRWEASERLCLRHRAACAAADSPGGRYVSVALGQQLHGGGGHEQLAVEEAFGVCVPRLCDGRAVWRSLVPALVGPGVFAAVEDLHAWSSLPVFAVIAGFAKCGTSTLAANLHEHPDIAVARCSDSEACEYGFWSTEARNEFLLTSSALAEFASSFARVGKSPGARHVVKDSRLLEDDRAIRRLAEVEGVRVVVVLRDPADALESHFRATECWRVQSFADVAAAGAFDCLGGSGWGSWPERLEALVAALPPGSVFVTHLAAIAGGKAQSAAYNEILQFLGIPPERFFRSDHVFRARNVGQGSRRIDVCAPEHRPALELLAARHQEEHRRLATLLAALGPHAARAAAMHRTSSPAARCGGGAGGSGGLGSNASGGGASLFA